jgi:transposase
LGSAEFKAQAVQASRQPGIPVTAVATARGINANLLRRLVHEMAQPPIEAAATSDMPVDFIALPMPTPAAPPQLNGEPTCAPLSRTTASCKARNELPPTARQ